MSHAPDLVQTPPFPARGDPLSSVGVFPLQLTGNRKGVWSLFVTKNLRITFRIDQDDIEIIDLDYEDYH